VKLRFFWPALPRPRRAYFSAFHFRFIRHRYIVRVNPALGILRPSGGSVFREGMATDVAAKSPKAPAGRHAVDAMKFLVITEVHGSFARSHHASFPMDGARRCGRVLAQASLLHAQQGGGGQKPSPDRPGTVLSIGLVHCHGSKLG